MSQVRGRMKNAKLYVISDTLLHKRAQSGQDDPRPVVVFCVSDCDPAGWQMPISIARSWKPSRLRIFLIWNSRSGVLLSSGQGIAAAELAMKETKLRAACARDVPAVRRARDQAYHDAAGW